MGLRFSFNELSAPFIRPILWGKKEESVCLLHELHRAEYGLGGAATVLFSPPLMCVLIYTKTNA